MTLAVKCPILGFEETKNMEFTTIDEIFVRLKSLDGKDFSFVLINPYLIRPDYEFDIPTYYQELLSLTPESKQQVFNIVALAKTIEESTVNFLAPVVINLDNNTMAQVILDTVHYPDFFQAEKISNYIKK
ncbi:flagellar assembly protein FliW [Campylobacter vulpis]|uniref:Flagellar assembly factor FliW n=1 Tax=Campylobacter vulpis TaxID=1655500 RepID=A0A2G4R100_9BACT|nr:flagellar assembly protein FliW [Campylobacter vulpis]MBS4236102.1 flagellar assembly protein FliW [Campylobacter vulpis]MBS4241481.1 flagellar assembly protein FliW [Campylobacter vulpis]MBS4253080.1 flagellar assembly protein FliW [Campylobacter vulpis]MBS4269668.1 flagellar assembly protein FliW [Campylobacter vulpis]MBS4275940.1 flagellar assembly protein FliW [Campylobacter vulpis]